MASDFRDRLQASLGSAYTIERELGGGGMSRVFVATETAFDRRVVVKVLPPELAAGVSTDRFKREILVAARLQHPHIVPVLAAGETEGLPYFTMPLVEGSSLRARLADGPLPITEVAGILKEVARALAYAHEHGVVHRDIKPDNVLLTGGTAVVTDFGIAKAITAARATSEAHPTLTTVGTSLGTPTYMAPEQGAGDPDTDHRADLYSLGVMAYELLTGRPPFQGMPPHKLLAAHMGETPVPILERRPDVPPALAELVTRCLAKDAAARPQTATEVVRALDSVNSSASYDPMPEALRAPRHALAKALAMWAGATVAVAVLAKAAIVGIGLPDWVFPGALVVMGLGLPVILFTAFVHRQARKALATTPTVTPGGTATHGTMSAIALRASPHVSWRRTARGGVIAVGAFVVIVAGWMTMRALGIGPAASLMAAGAMGERDRVILAEFESPASDSLLGPTITEAFRTDLAQSANLSIMPENATRDVLRRMQRPPNARVDFALAREIATREGMKAIVDGRVTALGGGYVLSARLVAAQTGEELAVVRETADEPGDLIPAIGELSRALRSRLGESLRAVQNTPRLDQVTTSSLEALQKYVAAQRAAQLEGDFEKGVRLLEEAIALDSNFAMAYRRLGVEYGNRGDNARSRKLIRKGYDLRDRLSDAERYLMIGTYHTTSEPDLPKAIAAYEGLLELQPDNVVALNNLANIYRFQRQFQKTEELAKRAIALQQGVAVFHNNLVLSQISQGKLDEANRSVDNMAASMPRNPNVTGRRAEVLSARRQFDSVRAIMDSMATARAADAAALRMAAHFRKSVAQVQGRMREAERQRTLMREAEERLGFSGARLNEALDAATTSMLVDGDTASAVARVDRALAATPLDSLAPADRPYLFLSVFHALTGQAARARALLADFERTRDEAGTGLDARDRALLEASLAMTERRFADAATTSSTRGDAGPCTVCTLGMLAHAWDLAGNADSAIATFERYVATPSETRLVYADYLFLAGSFKRLGELYDAKGDHAKAASNYAKFVELWKDADPELQPQVTQVRNRLRELQRAERP